MPGRSSLCSWSLRWAPGYWMCSASGGGRFFSRFAGWVSLPAVLVLAAGACSRVGVWQSEESLWRDAVQKAPGMPNPHYQLGNALLGLDRKDEALGEFGQAIKADPAFYP